MNRSSDELLSRSRFPEDADGYVAASDARHERVDLAHPCRMTDHSFEPFGDDFARPLFLLCQPAQVVVIGARVKQRGDGLARVSRPAIHAADVEQLVIAARKPVRLAGVGKPIEIGAAEQRKRSDLVPLTEPVSRSESPADFTE